MLEHFDGRNRGSVDQHLLCLYLITLNGKKYVGQTNCTSRRFSQHKKSTFKGSLEKLSEYFGVHRSILIKHKKRLGLANKYERKFTDEELLKIDEELKGDVNKLSEYFQVVHCVIYKHRKRLGLSGKCYNN